MKLWSPRDVNWAGQRMSVGVWVSRQLLSGSPCFVEQPGEWPGLGSERGESFLIKKNIYSYVKNTFRRYLLAIAILRSAIVRKLLLLSLILSDFWEIYIYFKLLKPVGVVVL